MCVSLPLYLRENMSHIRIFSFGTKYVSVFEAVINQRVGFLLTAIS